ncbi:protein-(glutamine-N5) methyltransferase, release factor-specific [Chloroherpeton thalassium ATCC 35110]|uniref:Release factor glutamine methyltransferase n=1 Tax=Chloroherpeton thalassium (strain ATCC 35110 / GB-78) TaxID=517418 RepID=B3QSG7_CHLT3|nr:peptide chain release factor N(5)-glutamine methyltransferase [Chloroherpeton thalassium]ACF12558.1 protein-(glutamine-N5) methyltransferase, release factor-specific [Chloroherpeton thalassium ATCC 35110]
MSQSQNWTVLSLLKASSDFFAQKNIDDARLNAELLLAHTLNLKRMDLYLKFDMPVTEQERQTFRELCKRRLEGEPVQYIIGNQDFFGLTLDVDSRVLIPRPETELLVEEALNSLSQLDFGDEKIKILDIGTGSGCIALAFASQLSNAEILAVDVSSEALALAKQNSEKNKLKSEVRFLNIDMLSAHFYDEVPGSYHLIISNPPYIPIAERDSLQVEVRNFEPAIALFVQQGFEFYEKIAQEAARLLKPNGLLCFELHADGATKVNIILKKNGFEQIRFVQDYAGFSRIAIASNS